MKTIISLLFFFYSGFAFSSSSEKRVDRLTVHFFESGSVAFVNQKTGNWEEIRPDGGWMARYISNEDVFVQAFDPKTAIFGIYRPDEKNHMASLDGGVYRLRCESGQWVDPETGVAETSAVPVSVITQEPIPCPYSGDGKTMVREFFEKQQQQNW